MKKALKVLKEIGITMLLLAGVLGIAMVLFIDKIPIAVKIPEPEIYVMIDKGDYVVSTDGIENAQSDTVVFQSTSNALETYGSDLRYISGKTEPMVNPAPGKSDIPTDVIINNTEINSNIDDGGDMLNNTDM